MKTGWYWLPDGDRRGGYGWDAIEIGPWSITIHAARRESYLRKQVPPLFYCSIDVDGNEIWSSSDFVVGVERTKRVALKQIRYMLRKLKRQVKTKLKQVK